MFSNPAPRLFALPPGADFGREVVAGLESRLHDQPPEAWANVTLFVNTRRMQRRIREVFDAGPPRLLPRLRLITDLALDAIGADLPPAISPLRRRLELSQLVGQLLDRQPDLAPRSALFDLSDSLATLLDEMQGEGVGPDALAALDVTDLSGHWARALQFLQIVQRFSGDAAASPDREARQRQVILRLIDNWKLTPPPGPVIVAGSTGSRGATALLLQAVAQVPQGAVILPGFDFDLPLSVWDKLDDALAAEDHPQFRFRRLMDRLDLTAADVKPWWSRLLSPVPLAGIAGATAALVFTMVGPSGEPTRTLAAVDSQQAVAIQEIAETETLIAAADQLENFSDNELVSLIGF